MLKISRPSAHTVQRCVEGSKNCVSRGVDSMEGTGLLPSGNCGLLGDILCFLNHLQCGALGSLQSLSGEDRSNGRKKRENKEVFIFRI
ncbi:hypothetical protein O3P69_003099 [Scylla paramamosain]|uniref:Uncharacterized protein n=1 Tax=Scylla paramamosain TaxID=85552 RepID=A0AAW0UJ35_SCYPA